MIVGDFNTIISIMDRKTKEKMNKKTEDLDNIATQLDLTDITEHATQQSRLHFLYKCPGRFSQTD